MVCPAISYSFGATTLIFCRMFIHILWRCACPQDFDFHQIFSKWQVVGLSHFVRPSGYRYMVCPAISSYRIGATALIFCMMFMHIMEVDLFIISYGQVGGMQGSGELLSPLSVRRLSSVRPLTFHILINSSETTGPIWTKLWWNGPWMAPFQNCVRRSRLPTKMAAKLNIEKRGDEILIVHCCLA